MATYEQEVIKIEELKGEKGPFKLLHIKGKEKPKKVWGEIAGKFTVPGKYANTYEQPEGSEFFQLVKAELLGGAAAPVASNGNGLVYHNSDTNKSITTQVIFKAAAEIVAAKHTSTPAFTAADGVEYLLSLIKNLKESI